MNNFFEGLANQNNAKVTSTIHSYNDGLRAGGSITITKGSISIDISYWADVYKNGLVDGYITIDDYDWNLGSTYISGVEIDSLSSFTKALKDMGLSTVSQSLQISNDEIRPEIFKAIESSDSVKNVFKGYKVWNLLNDEQKKNVVLNFAIDNYDTIKPNQLRHVGIIGTEDKIPSLESLINMKNGK
jgi:hypothetical protein